MKTLGYRRSIPGVGVSDRPGFRRIVISFDAITFDQIRNRAIEEGTSFAEQVRTFTEWGLEATERKELA